MRRVLRWSDAARAAAIDRLRRHLAARPEVRFALVHGSFAEGGPFRDIDLGVSVASPAASGTAAAGYELALETELVGLLQAPVDVRVLERAPLSFRHAATRGTAIFVRDAGALADFREATWRDYLDFAPLREEALRDLLRPRQARRESD
jgi:predicted nucleotidyltransferase